MLFRSGYAVVAPPQPVELAGMPRVGWWRIDPASGTTLGILANGTGGTIDEYLSLTANIASLAIRVLSLMRCIQQMEQAQKAHDRKKTLRALACVLGHIIGIAGQSMKLHNLYHSGNKAAQFGSGVTDFTKEVGSGIGFGGAIATEGWI